MTILKTSVSEQLSQDYLSYAISTLNRSLPSAIDGLKVSQRRILQCAIMDGLTPDSKYVKSAKLAGSVMGKLHPHSSAYDTMVRLANPSEMNHPLIDLHGNGGGFSPNGQRISSDSAASERYTELKLSQFAYDVYFADYSYKHTETKPNYDETLDEIKEFVPALPMSLFNGGTGIGCGYSTSLPFYNLREFNKFLGKHVNGEKAKIPCFDFPQGCNLLKNQGLADSMSGRGSLFMYGSVKVNETQGKIIIKELPTGSAETFCEKIKKAHNEDKLPMLGGVHDLSDQSGIHIEVTTKKRKRSEVNNLLDLIYKHTNLADNISINQTVLYGTTPQTTNIIEIVDHWLVKRREILLKMFSSDYWRLNTRLEELNILYRCLSTKAKRKKLGLILTTSDDVEQDLIKAFKLDDSEVNYILKQPIRKITKLNEDELLERITSLEKEIAKFKDLIDNPGKIDEFILNQVEQITKTHGKKRQTRFVTEKKTLAKKPTKARKDSNGAKTKTKAELWMEKALKEGEKLKKPIKKRGINALIKSFYSGESGFDSLDKAWEHEKSERNGVKVPRKRKKAIKKQKNVNPYLWVKTREDAAKAFKDANVEPLGKRGVTISLNKGTISDRVWKHVKQQSKKLKKG